MNKEQLIEKFKNNPKSMNAGAGKLAKRYGLSRDEVISAKQTAIKWWTMNKGVIYNSNAQALLHDCFVNLEKDELKSEIETDFEPKTVEELAKLHKIDLNKYKISNYWSKLKSNGKFTSSVFATAKNPSSDEESFRDIFKQFLTNFKPCSEISKRKTTVKKNKVSLILPKQDAHFNKFDILGENDILKRFAIISNATLNMLEKAISTNSLEQVVYIVGSDQFNSEWTSLTTKGTPQQNILSYQEAFKAICNHEVEIINTLLHYSEKVKVIFVPGNHDEFVGWHLINWLETYFRGDRNAEFDSSTLNTKYIKYNDSAIMINHGDDIKPKELVYKFPIGFKDYWSECNHRYIFTGDKHTELSLDIHGVKFYQVPQLSSAKSKWDDKKGYIDSRAEMTGFIISSSNGMTDIYKEIL